jgi:predicted Zn finger-like uncharacterized protein
MIIQCPYCATRFHLDEARLTTPNPMLKCSRCRHIFPAPSRAAGEAAGAPSPPQASEPPAEESPSQAPQNLSFSFSENSAKEPPPDLTIDEPEPEFELGTGPIEPRQPSLTARRAKPFERPLERVEESTEEEAVERRAAPLRRPRRSARERDEEPEETFADDLRADEVDEPFEEEERTMPRGISLRPIFVFLGLVVAAYAVIAGTLRARPELADSLFRQVPFISTLTEDRLLNRKIVLSDVTGGYQRIKDGENVFVIAGRALNNAPVTVRNVQILGRLFDQGSRQLDEKTIFCGNVISMKILRSLTQREVSILQNLKPPKRFGIAPGEESTFVIVFMQPPNGVTQFSSQVISAQRQA